MAFINKTEGASIILTDAIKTGKKLQLEADIKVEVTSFGEERI